MRSVVVYCLEIRKMRIFVLSTAVCVLMYIYRLRSVSSWRLKEAGLRGPGRDDVNLTSIRYYTLHWIPSQATAILLPILRATISLHHSLIHLVYVQMM